MRILFSKNAWEDYTWWAERDRKMLKRINRLIREILRDPYEGSGKPEPLKFDLTGYWSRRIDREHRLVYQADENEVRIYTCRYHYR